MPPFNPFLQAYRADPYPAFAHMRAEAPVYFGSLDAWYVTRYAEVAGALRDPRLLSNPREYHHYPLLRGRAPAAGVDVIEFTHDHWLMFQDPPDHTRLRAWGQRGLSPSAVEALRPVAAQQAEVLLDRLAAADAPDVVADAASRLPLVVIAALLGIPAADMDKVYRWAPLAYVSDSVMAIASVDTAGALLAEMLDYLRHLFVRRRETPTGDLISQLVNSRVAGQPAEDDDLLGMCTFIFSAGHATARSMLANGTLLLLQNPAEFERLQREPALAASAVEEFLRYESPIQITARVAREPLALGGEHLEAGQRVLLFLGAANHDPAQFPDPERLDVGRAPNQHLALGYGAHYCLGAALARIEGAAFFQALARRLPHLRLGPGPLRWHPSIAFRELKALPVTL